MSTRNRASGFTLIEMVIALVILFIAVMGVFAAITYAVKYNRGNSQRSQSLAVFQREIELLRSAKFTPHLVDNVTTPQPTCATLDNGSRDITGSTVPKPPQIRCGADGTLYLVETTVDDDPRVPGLQDYNDPPHPDPLPANYPIAHAKEITIEATPQGVDGAWVTANRVRIVMRRVRAN